MLLLIGLFQFVILSKGVLMNPLLLIQIVCMECFKEKAKKSILICRVELMARMTQYQQQRGDCGLTAAACNRQE